MRINASDWKPFTEEWLGWQAYLRENPSYTQLAIAMREEDRETPDSPVEEIEVYLSWAAVLTRWFYETQNVRNLRRLEEYTREDWRITCQDDDLTWRAVKAPYVVHAYSLSELTAKMKVHIHVCQSV